MKIAQVSAHQILDSRGFPTVEVHLKLDNGYVATASVPSGSSVGRHEVVEMRDRDLSSFLGLSVEKAIASVNTSIAPPIAGWDISDQTGLDQMMIQLDGTPNKAKLGGNAILGVSIAAAKAGAAAENLPDFAYLAKISDNGQPLFLPTPMFNIINGGKHGGGNLDIQEFMIVPVRRTAYSTALKMGDEVYLNLKEILAKRGLLTTVGDEGGFAPTLYTNAAALDLITEAIRAAGFSLGRDIFIALDMAATQLKAGDHYNLKDSSESFSPEGLISFYRGLIEKYSILSLEDPFAEDDWPAWNKLRQSISSYSLIVGDDLTVTNPTRVKQAIAEQSITGLIVKPNQIGTISETIDVVKIARESALTILVSHRSGETEDTFIADFAVGIGADYFKGGAPARGERVAKYNRLLEIEAQLAATAS